jgi:hypothetical protein
MPESQSYKNHARFDPLYHFAVTPVLLLNLIFSIYTTIHHWPVHRALFVWWIVVSIALIGLALRSRTFALKAQDRVIRMEERFRIAALLPPTEHARAASLTEAQLIALRFASDAELPALVERTLAENLGPAEIKKSINKWRPDNFRV